MNWLGIGFGVGLITGIAGMIFSEYTFTLAGLGLFSFCTLLEKIDDLQLRVKKLEKERNVKTK